MRAKVDALEAGVSASAAIAQLEQRMMAALQRIDAGNAARDSVVEHLWHKVIDREHDLAAAIAGLVEFQSTLTERLETEGRHQRELMEVLQRALPRSEGASESTPRVIGGSMFATEAPGADVIDLDEPRRSEGWHTAS